MVRKHGVACDYPKEYIHHIVDKLYLHRKLSIPHYYCIFVPIHIYDGRNTNKITPQTLKMHYEQDSK